MSISRDIETRAALLPVKRSGSRTIGGIANRYGTLSRPMSAKAIGSPVNQPFIETFENRCWAKSEGDGWPDCRATLEHRDLLGTTAAGTMRLSNNATALSWEVDCPNTNAGDEALEHVRIGNIRGSSVDMLVYSDTYEFRGDMPVRHIDSARLIGVSAVCMPAYPDTSVALRSLAFGLARQFDADPDEIAELVAQGEVRSLFTRTDQLVSAPVTVLPGELAESRSSSGELEIRRRRNALEAKREMGNSTDGELELRRRRNKLMGYRPIESRSEPWHPSCA